MIDGISTTTSTTSTAEYATESKSSLDKDAFLQLMIAQLKNQDPLEPMDGTDYSAQLAQFSSLEQLKNINDSLNNSIDANYLLTQSVNNTMTATLIGKNAKIAGDTISYEGQESTSFGYELPANAGDLKVVVKNSSGVVVKEFEDLEKTEGAYKLDWDFTDNEGDVVQEGEYTFELTASTLTGEDMTVAQYLIGTIEGVRFGSSGTSILVNGLEYLVSDVFEILENKQKVK
ncbi:MAG: flagellar hook capping FlgD N-terminal domain-containing protein [Melioribacteraceae bacterium]